MNVVDSSGWIEHLSGGQSSEFFRGPIEDEATPRAYGAHLWTQDADFDGLEDVRPKRKD